MKLPRWLHHWFANFWGYFWLPCPRCGEYFGGHEDGYGIIPDLSCTTSRYWGVCPDCTKSWQRGEWTP